MSKKASGAEASLLLDGLDYYETMIMDRAPNPTKSLFPHRRFLRHFGAKSYAELWRRRFEEEYLRQTLLVFCEGSSERHHANVGEQRNVKRRRLPAPPRRSRDTSPPPQILLSREPLRHNFREGNGLGWRPSFLFPIQVSRTDDCCDHRV